MINAKLYEVVRFLIKHKVDFKGGLHGMTSFIRACQLKDLKMIQILVCENQVNLKVEGIDGVAASLKSSDGKFNHQAIDIVKYLFFKQAGLKEQFERVYAGEIKNS